VPEVTVASLDVRQQKWVENAHLALERGQIDYVLDVCGSILGTAPGCLAVRRLQRRAQLLRFQSGNRVRRMIAGMLTGIFAGRTSRDAAESLAHAEQLLARNPASGKALRVLAEAAARLGLPETAAFALAAIRELEPDNRANLLALGEAWLVAGQRSEALRAAESMLATSPGDAAGLGLQRKASVAQTVAQGKWESAASFREQIRP
jgi:tetratricopeptide (TPR) repeat protein